MSYGQLAYWGCRRSGFFDLFNCARTAAYLRNHYADYGPRHECCAPGLDTYLPALPDPYAVPPYTNPADDVAWWYDPNRPESAGFLGFQITRWDGMFKHDSSRVKNRVSNGGCGDRLLYGNRLDNGRVITVEAIAYGLTCCSVAYGIQALTRTLRGCCSDGCSGTNLRLLSCIPELVPHGCNPTWLAPAETTSPWRTLHNVSVMEEPVITNTAGQPSCGCSCTKTTRIRFTLTASPGLYLDAEVFLPEQPIVGGANCDLFCEPTSCDTIDWLQDPECDPPLLPEPLDATSDCYCPPLIGYRTCATINLDNTRLFDTELEARICAGSAPLRNVRIQAWAAIPGVPYDPSIYNDCNVCADFAVSYIPVGGCWVRSACHGVNVYVAGQMLEASNTLFTGTRPGSSCLELPCGEVHICITSDTNVAADATIELSLVEREP